MKARKDKRRTKNRALLVSVAESIGSTLGAIAKKAGEAQRALTGSSVAHTKEREGKKLMRKSKRVARQTRNAASANLEGRLARPIRRGLRRATSSAKRSARRGTTRARTSR